MHVDDRLATVLRQRAEGERAARTQYRQLLDLLGERSQARDDPVLSDAWDRLAELNRQIPAAARAAVLRERGWRFHNPMLAALLAEDDQPVAAAALARAELSERDWMLLIPELPLTARGFLRLRRDLPPGAQLMLARLGIHDQALPQPASEAGREDHAVAAGIADHEADDGPPKAMTPPQGQPATETIAATVRLDAADRQEDAGGGIAALVRRIEAFQRRRDHSRNGDADHTSPPVASAPAVLPDPPDAFLFQTDPDGVVVWAEPALAPMLLGQSLLGNVTSDPANASGRPAFALQLPVRQAVVNLRGSPVIAGEWSLDATPRFATPGGWFLGHQGRATRGGSAAGRAMTRAARDADRIRQLLHELRTPVNAIQGFAEIIQQQLFGPAPHEYRALAATIAGDSARMLAGFDELERLASLESGALRLEAGDADLAETLSPMLTQLRDLLAPRGVELPLTQSGTGFPVRLSPGDCERLCWRLVATLGGLAAHGERIGLDLRPEGGSQVLRLDMPDILARVDDVFSGSVRLGTGVLSAGFFGTGFALRLARAEAAAGGGRLLREGDRLRLDLPAPGPTRQSIGTPDFGFAAAS